MFWVSPACSCSSCLFSPCPQLCLWCPIITSHQQDFWHIHMFGCFFFFLSPSFLYWLIFFFLKVQFICFRDAGSGKATKDSGSPLPYFIIYDTSGSPRLSSSDWDLYSQLPTPEGLALQSKRSEKRERKSISLPLGLSDLVLDAGGSSSFVSSVGSCGACHFTRVCHRIADSWGSLCLSVSLLDAQCSESLSPSHQRELSLEARAPTCLW